MIDKEKIQEVKDAMRHMGKTYDHLIVWQDENDASFDGEDAMIEISEKTKQVTVVTNSGIKVYNYKLKWYIGGMFIEAIRYILI